MRFNVFSAVALVVSGLITNVGSTYGDGSLLPTPGEFNERAKPLEPTPAAKRPASSDLPAAASKPSARRSRSLINRSPARVASQPSRPIPSDSPTQDSAPAELGTPGWSSILETTDKSRETSRASDATNRSYSAADRLRKIRGATADPEVNILRTEQPVQTFDKTKSPAPSQLPAVPRHRIGTSSTAQDAAQPNPAPSEKKEELELGPASRVASRPNVASSVTPPRGSAISTATSRELLLANTGPAISVKATGPRTIVIGKTAAYTLIVANQGDVAAQDVTVDVGLPTWAEVVNTQASVGAARTDAGTEEIALVTWKIPNLQPRRTERLVLNIIPRESRRIDLAVRWGFAPPGISAQVEVQEPKLQLTLAGPQDVLYGESKVYTITLINPGTGDAENVVLNLLPLTPNTEVAGSREIGKLKPGDRKSIEIELTAQQAGRLQIRAHAFADGGLRAEASQEVIVRRANLQVAAAGPPKKYSGTAASYKIRLANTGDATASDVVVSAVLPAGAKYVTSSEQGQLDAKQGRVVWQVGTLRHGAVRILDLQCVLTSPGDNRLDVRCRAEGDLSAARSVVTAVEALADLKLAINDPKGAVAIRTDSEFEVRVMNRGTKAAEDIRVVGFFGQGVEPISVQGARGEITTGQVAFEPITRLDAGQEVVLKIVARSDTPGTHRFRVEVRCSNPDTELASEESTKFYGDPTAGARQAMAVDPSVQQR